MGVSKNRGKTPKMDGENNGTPYFLMDDLGRNLPLFSETPIMPYGFPSKKAPRRLGFFFSLNKTWFKKIEIT